MDMPIDIHHIQQCAPSAPTSIIEAIIRTESSFNPLAINMNRGVKLTRQPASRKEAEAWVRWLKANGYNFDAGLMQINSGNWEKLGLTPESVFDVCENIRAGSELFSENYSRATRAFGPGRTSLVSALSAYNTGDFNAGIRNGYVSRVVQNARAGEIGTIEEIPPLIPPDKNFRDPMARNRKKDNDTNGDGASEPFTAPTSIDGFMKDNLKPWDVKPESESMPASGEPEPGTVSQKERAPSGWQKETSMKSKRFLLTVLLAACLLTACAGRSTVPPSALAFRYVVSNSQEIGLIRAFDHQKTTVLQFVDLEHQKPLIVDEAGSQVEYQRIGQYAVLPGICASLTVRVQDQTGTITADPIRPQGE